MRYESIEDLPSTIRDVLPEEAQEIYLEAYNESVDDYEEWEGGEMSRESVANRDAWHAVKQEFVKNEETQRWYRIGEAPEEEDEDEGLIDKIKDVFQ
jgi:cation transport regulator